MSCGKACWATARGPLAAVGISLFPRKDPGGVMEKLRVALRGLSSEQRILQNKGGFAKRQLRGEAVPYSGFGEERNHTHEKTDPETGWPRPNPTSATN